MWMILKIVKHAFALRRGLPDLNDAKMSPCILLAILHAYNSVGMDEVDRDVLAVFKQRFAGDGAGRHWVVWELVRDHLLVDLLEVLEQRIPWERGQEYALTPLRRSRPT